MKPVLRHWHKNEDKVQQGKRWLEESTLEITCTAQLDLHFTLSLRTELYSALQLPSKEKWAVAALWGKLGQTSFTLSFIISLILCRIATGQITLELSLSSDICRFRDIVRLVFLVRFFLALGLVFCFRFGCLLLLIFFFFYFFLFQGSIHKVFSKWILESNLTRSIALTQEDCFRLDEVNTKKRRILGKTGSQLFMGGFFYTSSPFRAHINLLFFWGDPTIRFFQV